MARHQSQQSWEKYRDKELTALKPFLQGLGFALDQNQVHVGGERYLSSGHKLILLGHRISDQKRVVIKISNDRDGIKEIKKERASRDILKKINFAYHAFLSPPEILYKQKGPYTMLITAFIEQDSTFLERPLADQFFLALQALEAQEGAHATTYEHTNLIKKVFGRWQAQQYLAVFNNCVSQITALAADYKIKNILEEARDFLQKNADIIDLYSDFLVHWDFVPHNIRVQGHDIYLLDYSSLRFGNKYEGWARFINFMTLYNRSLEKMLLDYIRQNRSVEEYLSLRLMRVFRLTEIIKHYAQAIPRSSGNLELLNKKRLGFWTSVLESVLADALLPPEIVESYQRERDALRSSEEKLRQKELH